MSQLHEALPRAALKPLVLDFESHGVGERDDRKFITALARGLEVLRAFQSQTGRMSNKEISELTNIPKPSITRLTYTLSEMGYLQQSNIDGKYELSAGILSLGYPLLSGLAIRHLAHDQMAELANSGGCSVALGARDRLSIVYVDECCGNSSTTLRLDIGARIEIARSAIGRAWLAGLSEELRQDMYKQLDIAYHTEWPELRSRIEDAESQIKERGFCLVDQEWRKDTRTVSVPLVSNDGKTVMALSCGGPTFSISVASLEEEFGPRLRHIGEKISRFLGK
ncbi:MAG: helix-turn-helix domain-containing protein [Gammaproteobacteria bacterium]|nr:helix-turn-helix domain-containing protein [Gammaproteobacteria bacterium]